MAKERIIVVGAGLAGSLIAIYLAKRGFQVEVFELRPDMRTAKISAGRSINLALSRRGIDALAKVGLADKMLEIATPMKGRMMHAVDGLLAFQPYGKCSDEVIYAVSRGELNKALMTAAEQFDIMSIRFQEKCLGMDLRDGGVRFLDLKNGREHTEQAITLVGADGANSAVRHDMAVTPRFSLSKQFIEHGYKELYIPPAVDGGYRIDKNALHIWPRGRFMLIALPNLDGSFTCTLFLPYESETGFENLRTKDAVRSFFERQFPDAIPLMPTLLDDFFEHPTGDLVTIKCNPWSYRGKAVLLGDAAHAVVPFLGQGMNCAFESCIILDECIGEFADNWDQVYRNFERRRRDDSDALADMALENFIEMRDRVADERFLLKKEVERELERRFEPRFRSKYGLIQFHKTPYAEAMRLGVENDRLLEEITERIDAIENLDWEKAERLIEHRAKENRIQ